MTFEEKWKNRMAGSFKDDKEYILKTFDEDLLQKHVRSHMIQRNVNLGLNEFLNKRVDETKIRFSMSAMLSEYCFLSYNRNWPYWDMKSYSYALLSDNIELIDRYSNLPIDEHSLYDDPQKGVPAFWNYLIQGLLSENTEQVEKGKKALYDSLISKNKEISLSRAHEQCTEGIGNSN